MQQKSEKIIYIKLKNIILKQIFDELILILNECIEDIRFVLIDSSNLLSESPLYFISDSESINQLVEEENSKKIKKIFLMSRKPSEIKSTIEIINYELPFKFINFIDYIANDLRQNYNKQNKIILLKSLNYDKSSRRIFNESISLILTEKENEIFNFLLSCQNSVSKKILLKNVWEYNESIDTHTLETHIYSLRKKLEQKLKVKNILEHKRNGYFLNRDLL
ncbi:MAG: winged helix-turn-helix domain-containing protein [Pelagibacterales bacterium]|nr:winged helix-turn-helix domain-containing protein [Pelagibacterales bacterium]